MIKSIDDSSIRWLSAADLGLPSAHRGEWEAYRFSLMAAGIHFTEDSDHLVWEDNPLQGSVSAKLAYNILMEDIGDNVVTGLRRILWSDKLPLKISCFIWLCMENKILTWQNYKAVVSVVPGCVIYVIAHLKISIIYSG